MEIVPISKESVVCLSKKLTHQLGGISAVCLVHKTTNALHLIDVSSGQGRMGFFYLKKRLKFFLTLFRDCSNNFVFIIFFQLRKLVRQFIGANLSKASATLSN